MGSCDFRSQILRMVPNQAPVKTRNLEVTVLGYVQIGLCCSLPGISSQGMLVAAFSMHPEPPERS